MEGFSLAIEPLLKLPEPPPLLGMVAGRGGEMLGSLSCIESTVRWFIDMLTRESTHTVMTIKKSIFTKPVPEALRGGVAIPAAIATGDVVIEKNGDCPAGFFRASRLYLYTPL
jgi:hypothetical protein